MRSVCLVGAFLLALVSSTEIDAITYTTGVARSYSIVLTTHDSAQCLWIQSAVAAGTTAPTPSTSVSSTTTSATDFSNAAQVISQTAANVLVAGSYFMVGTTLEACSGTKLPSVNKVTLVANTVTPYILGKGDSTLVTQGSYTLTFSYTGAASGDIVYFQTIANGAKTCSNGATATQTSGVSEKLTLDASKQAKLAVKTLASGATYLGCIAATAKTVIIRIEAADGVNQITNVQPTLLGYDGTGYVALQTIGTQVGQHLIISTTLPTAKSSAVTATSSKTITSTAKDYFTIQGTDLKGMTAAASLGIYITKGKTAAAVDYVKFAWNTFEVKSGANYPWLWGTKTITLSGSSDVSVTFTGAKTSTKLAAAKTDCKVAGTASAKLSTGGITPTASTDGKSATYKFTNALFKSLETPLVACAQDATYFANTDYHKISTITVKSATTTPILFTIVALLAAL